MTSPCVSCGAPATMQCPKCRDLGVDTQISVFCAQACFKASWSEHKKVHKSSQVPMFVLDSGKSRCPDMPQWAWTGSLRPAKVMPARQVPQGIPLPDWASTGVPMEEMRSNQQLQTLVRTKAQIEALRKACELGRATLDEAHRHVKPGVTTDEIDRVVHDFIVERGAYPSPLRYHHFPKSVCTSVNEVICHGIPDRRELQEGDIVNVDVSCLLNGAHGDLNETFAVGQVDSESKKLMKVAYECLMNAVSAAKPGMRYREVGEIITKHARANDMSVVRTYCGHGIGDLFHCAPNVPHFAKNKAKGIMQEGHTFTIEPMINLGGHKDFTWPDGWTAVTQDGTRSAQFEHTIVITDSGCDVLTARQPDSPDLEFD
eukprot:jgi/Ulvmu1/7381/UM036_0041.1